MLTESPGQRAEKGGPSLGALDPRFVARAALAMGALLVPVGASMLHAALKVGGAFAWSAALGFGVAIVGFFTLARLVAARPRRAERAAVYVVSPVGAGLSVLTHAIPTTPLVPVALLVLTALGVAFVQLVALLRWRRALLDRARAAEEARALADRRAEERAHELKSAIDEAMSASDAKADFLATMSHEIRTPMNAVVGMTSLLLDTKLTREQAEYTQTIRTSSEHLLTILSDILDFSKIEAGMVILEFISFDVAQLVEETVDLVAATANAKGLDVTYAIADGTPARVTSDPTRVRQILANLLANAVKFTASGEVVVDVSWTASGEPSHGELAFGVRDTGIGIPADKIDRLFQSFSQVDAATSRRFGGTGLGLVIVKNLAELMGGRAWVTSEEGRGSTFSFTVGARVDAPPALGATSLSGMSALVVDDGPANRAVLVKMLDRWGMTTTAAASGEEALALEGTFDVALIDYRMPGMDGLALSRELRKRSATTRLVLVASEPVDVAQAREAGVDLAAVLAKPLKLSRLLDALTTVVAGGAKRATPRPPSPEIDATFAARHPLAILVAEDNIVNQRVVAATLAKLGYSADIAGDGEAALAATESKPYDLILMDIQMPKMDGLAATRALRARERDLAGKALWIVALTANATQDDRRACMDAGMDDYLSKPVTPKALTEALRRASTRGDADAS